MSAFSTHSGHHMRLVPIPLYRVLAFIILFPAVLGELGEGGAPSCLATYSHLRQGRGRQRESSLLEEKNHAQEEHHMFRSLAAEINGGWRDGNGGSDGTRWPRSRPTGSTPHIGLGRPIPRQSLCGIHLCGELTLSTANGPP